MGLIRIDYLGVSQASCILKGINDHCMDINRRIDWIINQISRSWQGQAAQALIEELYKCKSENISIGREAYEIGKGVQRLADSIKEAEIRVINEINI